MIQISYIIHYIMKLCVFPKEISGTQNFNDSVLSGVLILKNVELVGRRKIKILSLVMPIFEKTK